jgi:hypothetical protein
VTIESICAALFIRTATRTLPQVSFLEAAAIVPAPLHITVTAIPVSWMKPPVAINIRGAAFDPHANTAGETNVR